MTAALAIRLTLLMTLMPGADTQNAGRAARGPGRRAVAQAVPGRDRDGRLHLAGGAGPGPVEQLRDMLLAGIDAGHREHDHRAVTVGDLDTGSIDGSLTRVPDSDANRQAYGSAGTTDDSSPYRSYGQRLEMAVCVVHGPLVCADGAICRPQHEYRLTGFLAERRQRMVMLDQAEAVLIVNIQLFCGAAGPRSRGSEADATLAVG